MLATLPLLQDSGFPAPHRGRLDALQVNLGYRCNQTCRHCHVNAGPNRTEMMGEEMIGLVPRVLEARRIGTLDLTGGTPELHPQFRELVAEATALGAHVIDRCNLTILLEAGQGGIAEFLAGHGVEIVASLPCYTSANVDKQRGEGVFDKSIAALKLLNALGYGQEDSGLVLNLVYNPSGPVLPSGQVALQADYKRELLQNFGVVFNRLYVMTNMPIQRFGSALVSGGQFNDYLRLLKGSFSAANLGNVMCRNLVSADWQGYLYDCDFNQQLGLALPGKDRPHLRDLLHSGLEGNIVRVADHCYGCTAGQGSSCGGALHG